MLDRFDRSIDYLRISVTDRCNLRCTYCMPGTGIKLLNHSDILTFDEIHGFTEVAVKNGIRKVRITGGEPLVRKGIVSLVSMLAGIRGIEDLSMTTNGVLLGEFASELKLAGLHRVNISLDTVDPARFNEITGQDLLSSVLAGIDAAINAGLNPVKVNCVVKESQYEPDAIEVAKYCSEKGLQIRYIRQMDIVNGHFYIVNGGSGGDCSICNRLRLTSDGKLKPCLFNDAEINIREIGFEQAIKMAVQQKPACGTRSVNNKFYSIGG